MRLLQCLAGPAAALFLAATPAHAQEAPVALGRIDISFYAVTAAVVQEVLERLGHRVDVTSGSHSQIFPKLGSGEVDLLVAAWLPSGHAGYWEQYGGDALQLATLYRDAQLYWAVPSYIPAADVSKVEDLKKPEVAHRMVKSIRSTAPDSGLAIGSRKIMEAYQLERAGYELVAGKRDPWVAHLEDNLAARRWFVMPFFRPNYLNLSADMRILDEPHRFLGESNDGVLVARKDFAGAMPQRTIATLARIHLGLEAVMEMDRMVNVDKMTPEAAARSWMGRNRSVVDAWFQP